MARCADRQQHRRQPPINEDLIGAQHVSWMMCLQLKARRGEDKGELAAFKEAERRKREAAGHLLPVDIRHPGRHRPPSMADTHPKPTGSPSSRPGYPPASRAAVSVEVGTRLPSGRL